MSVNDQTLTIPAAADHINFSVSTLRNYVRAWERSFGPLPKDMEGWTRLVRPLLDVLNDAHALWPTQMNHKERIVHALEKDPVTIIVGISDAYRYSDFSESLVGVERFSNWVTRSALRYLAMSIQDLNEEKKNDRRETEKATEEQVDDLRTQLSEISETLATDLHGIAKATLKIALRMEKVTAHLLEPDAFETGESFQEE